MIENNIDNEPKNWNQLLLMYMRQRVMRHQMIFRFMLAYTECPSKG